MRLKDKVAIITGGTRGIGLAIARSFAREGAHVALIGMNRERGESAAGQVANSRFYAGDVSKSTQVEEVFAQIQQDLGAPSILVNNAGITRDGLLMKMKEEDWRAVIETNLNSIYFTCKSVIRPMMKARGGKIINITSVVGLMGNGGQTNYAASKAGMIGFSKALAKEVASRGICVNCIAPGFIETDMTDALNERQKEELLQIVPMGRLGTPEEIASAALFLASDESTYITGQVLTVDGGMVMG